MGSEEHSRTISDNGKVAEGTTRVGSEGDRANLTPTRPPVGTRLEVLWELHDDGVGGGTEARPSVRHVWWSCRVDAHDGYGAACETGVEGPVGARAHLLYDAMHGFAQERLLVTFLDEDTLQDESSGARLRWRREGEAFVLEAAVGVDGGTTTLAEVVEAQNAADAEAGVGLEEAATEAMGTLPHVAQVRMAMAYRDMSDFVKARLKKLVDERGAGAEVSADDIQALKVKKAKKEKKEKERRDKKKEKNQGADQQQQQPCAAVAAYIHDWDARGSGSGWKFNKNLQGFLLKHWREADIIEEAIFDKALAYLKPLKGGARDALIAKAKEVNGDGNEADRAQRLLQALGVASE
eukprot:PRCOL_00003768-RA